ncbi:MAG: PDZ domain-containing protein [Microbacteriaceae bacterium]
MALFTDIDIDEPRRSPRHRWVGWSLLSFALIVILAVAVIPSPYVVQKPGPVFDTLGSVQVGDEEVSLIDIEGETTFPTEGSLSMLTVSIQGNRDDPLTWFEVVRSWLTSSQAVIPLDDVYPPGTTSDDSAEQSRIEMESSQQEAIAAALSYLDYDFTSTLTVEGTSPDGASAELLRAGDIIVSVNGSDLNDVSALQAAIAENGVDAAATVVVMRDGTDRSFDIVPRLSAGETPVPVIGVLVSSDFDFPFDVTIQLENVGGPSAGQMFALGIIDKLTPGAMTGGAEIAGTGTITAAGQIGRIGGIRQKMFGALWAGADYFLAPASNCGEVSGFIPDGLTVFAVDTLDDSLAALDGIASGATENLATCPAA